LRIDKVIGIKLVNWCTSFFKHNVYLYFPEGSKYTQKIRKQTTIIYFVVSFCTLMFESLEGGPAGPHGVFSE